MKEGGATVGVKARSGFQVECVNVLKRERESVRGGKEKEMGGSIFTFALKMRKVMF